MLPPPLRTSHQLKYPHFRRTHMVVLRRSQPRSDSYSQLNPGFGLRTKNKQALCVPPYAQLQNKFKATMTPPPCLVPLSLSPPSCRVPLSLSLPPPALCLFLSPPPSPPALYLFLSPPLLSCTSFSLSPPRLVFLRLVHFKCFVRPPPLAVMRFVCVRTAGGRRRRARQTAAATCLFFSPLKTTECGTRGTGSSSSAAILHEQPGGVYMSTATKARA